MVHASEAQMAHDWDDYISEPDEAEEADEEEWRQVVGFEGFYRVSNRGAVRRLTAAQGTQAGKLLKPLPDDKGYLHYNLHAGDRHKRAKAHRLVATAFYGEPTGDAQLIRHLDGDPTNNRLENLRWGTARENSNDRILHGRATGWHAHKTHCKRGHAFDEANTRKKFDKRDGKFHRVCRTCHREQRQAREART